MNTNLKLLFGALVAFILIISVITTSLSLLKEETVSNYQTISKLNAKSMSKEINQDISNIEQIIENINSVLNIYDSQKIINNRLDSMKKNYAQIRSINLIRNNQIIYSSNKHNIDLIIDNLNLYPNPIFDENILKISTPWIGRDFISASDVYTYEDKIQGDESFFIPISKQIDTKKGNFNVVINLNNDYFINRFLTNIETQEVDFELIRLDGVLLLSTATPHLIGKKLINDNLLEKTIEKNELTTISFIDEVKYILTYTLTKNYPLSLGVRLDYEKNLLSWSNKQYDFFILTSFVLTLIIISSLILFYLYNKEKENQIMLQKKHIQEHEKFKLLFEDSHLMSLVLDDKANIIEISNTALKFLNENENYKNKEFWSLSCWDEKTSGLIKNLFNRKGMKSYSSEIKAFNNKKEEAILDFNLSIIKQNNIINYIVIAQDITQRKEKEKKLIQAFAVFNNTHDGIMITDSFCNIIDVNKSFENITKYEKNEIIGKNTRTLKSDLHDKNFYQKMWKSINEEGFWEGEIINLNKYNEYFTEWLTINSIKDKNGSILNYIGIFSDITEQKQKDKQLKDKEKVIYQQSKMAALGEMIENIAHQWRQPLSVISTSATGLKMQKELNILNEEEELNTLDTINKSAQYLSNTIDDFRNYLNNTKEKEDFNITKTIDYSLSLLSSKLLNREINIVKIIEDVNIKGIKNEFVQVIINIINNAKDAFENNNIEKKYLFISVKEFETTVEISIKDNAGGIPKDIINKVFEPYFTTKHQSQGTGIGLYMSEEIIRNHMNGLLKVHNENYIYNNKEYIGANFTIVLDK